MPESKGKLLVLGSKEFDGFTELDNLPAGIQLVGLGTADQMLGASILILSNSAL